jgi:hypothetical protein
MRYPMSPTNPCENPRGHRQLPFRWLAIAALLGASTLLAPARSAAAPAERTFAVVVTSNRSTRPDRSDLQYADDDGARYYRLFRGVAGADAVWLLTRFDRSTAAAHPDLVPLAEPPGRAQLLSALTAARDAVARARSRGERTQFYFVYAGHGDVELGKGYLDLEDARVDSDFLEKEVVERVGADLQHLMLDSCNSFFVVNPRKPGGRRWATPRDLALGFARRHTNVGLFLSTNTEAEVYEWSELESGIFSHEVRSGLSGAADVDGDGRVSYLELAGFVEQANAHLPRGNLRPHIFFRGPAGDDATALFAPSAASGRRLQLGAEPRRAWIRGDRGERLIDLHKEAGALTLVVPGRADQALSVVQWQAGATPDQRPSLRELQVEEGTAPVSLAQLESRPPSSATRGGAAMFGNLFQAPFGPRAFAAWKQQRAASPEPVYGVGAADESRMRHYLTFIADSENLVARSGGRMMMAIGGLFAVGAGATYFSTPRWEGSGGTALLAGAGGLALLGAGLHLGFSKSLGQRALEAFERELGSSPENRALAVANTEAYLDGIARRERIMSAVFTTMFTALAVSFATTTTIPVVRGQPGARRPAGLVAGYGGALLLGLGAWQMATMETSAERLLRLYRQDPDLKLRFGVTPLPAAPGSLGLGFSGRF